MGICRIMRPVLGLILTGILVPSAFADAAKNDGKVTDKTTAPAQNEPLKSQNPTVDYPSLCKMAESHRDWDAAWGFAEKWAASGSAEARRAGVCKLLELSFFRSGVDVDKLTAMAAEAGVPADTLQLFQARAALKQQDFRRAGDLLEKLAGNTVPGKEDPARIMHFLVLAKLGSRDFAAAAQYAARQKELAGNDAGRFQASCYRIYALSAGGNAGEARRELTALTAANPGRGGELTDLQMVLAANRKDWQEFDALFSKRGRAGEGSPWYFAACRTAAEQAEKTKDFKRAVTMRRAVLQAAAEDSERKRAVLELLSALEHLRAWKEMAQTLELYLSWYPGTSDRAQIQCQAARYLVKAGELPGALKLYDAVLAGEDVSADARYAAAMEAAEQCAAAKLLKEESQYLEKAVRYAPSPEKRQAACFRQGTYYERTGAVKRAQESFQMAAAEKGPLKEKAQLFRLQSLIRSKDFSEAMKAARELSSSQTPEFRTAAHYHLASLYEKTGQVKRAAAEYQAFAKQFPDSEFAAPALYNAALIAESAEGDAETVKRFRAFLQAAPKHELAPNAWYKILAALERQGKTEEAADAAEKLARDFPASPFAAAALFRLVDHAAAEKRHGAALEYLSRIEALPARHAGILARVLFDRASIHAKLDNPRKALELLDKLLAGHAADPVAADAAELAGYLSSLLGEYVQGAAFYARAAQLRPGGVFAFGCLERRADCLYSAACSGGSNAAKELSLAETEYRSLLQQGRAYAPLLFKIGRCREAAGDAAEAVRIYTEALYRQAADRRQGIRPDPVWAPRILYAAVRLNRAKRSLEGARNTLRIIALARQMGLEPDGSMEAIEQELQAKYKL